MKILTETMLRAATLADDTTEYKVAQDVFVTPLAKEFLRDRGIKLVVEVQKITQSAGVMTRTPIKGSGRHKFVDAVTGEGYAEKPEHMTHLRGNVLVAKTDARIAFRGSIDSLQADIIHLQAEVYEKRCEQVGADRQTCAQHEADAQGYAQLVADLGDVLDLVRKILGAEVKDEPLAEVRLFGLSDGEIREHSHNVKRYIGIEHPIPDYKMGKMAASLNRLRTKIREVELSAAHAFTMADGNVTRPDIIQALNRASSGAYIIFCRWLSGHYKGGSAR